MGSEIFVVLEQHGFDVRVSAAYTNYQLADEHATILEMNGGDVLVESVELRSELANDIVDDPTIEMICSISKEIANRVKAEMPLVDWTESHNSETLIRMISKRVGEELAR